MSMSSLLRSLWGRPVQPACLRQAPGRHFRPTLEGLEERTVPSVTPLAPAALAPALAGPAIAGRAVAHAAHPILSVTSITALPTQLLATVQLGNVLQNVTMQVEATLTTSANPKGKDCPILNLHLGAIDLTLLGLEVKTSPICLEINAKPGPGNLLGNLLCDVSHLLDQNPLADLTTLTSEELGAIQKVLNGVFSKLSLPSALHKGAAGAKAAADPTALAAVPILHLSLGPVNLNLLGLKVHLDNCNNGPVTVDIIAHPGEGLLGDLLGGLSQLLNRHALLKDLELILATV